MELARWNEGVPPLPSSPRYLGNLKEQTAWDLVASDLGIWSQRPNQGTGFAFVALQGRSSSDSIAANLRALDYQPAEYRGGTYYRLGEDLTQEQQRTGLAIFRSVQSLERSMNIFRRAPV